MVSWRSRTHGGSQFWRGTALDASWSCASCRSDVSLEREFPRRLHQSRRVCTGDLAEAAATLTGRRANARTIHIAADRRRPEELSMIEHIEGFHAQLQFCPLGHSHILLHGHVEVVEPRPKEVSRSRVSQLSQRRQAE